MFLAPPPCVQRRVSRGMFGAAMRPVGVFAGVGECICVKNTNAPEHFVDSTNAPWAHHLKPWAHHLKPWAPHFKA